MLIIKFKAFHPVTVSLDGYWWCAMG